MPPKEKANELYDKFFDTTVADITKAHRKAKHCAIIAVDEIIKDIKDSKPFFAFRYYSKYEIRIEYWQEVKQEIEKI
jgi:hypothetical protein